MAILNDKQRQLAKALKVVRPDVLPGTNVIPGAAARDAYYKQVQLAMLVNEVKGRGIAEFCDLAGVPD